MKVHGIFCNDSFEGAVVGDIEASDPAVMNKMCELMEADIEKHRKAAGFQFDAKRYARVMYWHVHTVDAVMVHRVAT